MHDAALLPRLLSVSSELAQFTYPEQSATSLAAANITFKKNRAAGKPVTLDHEFHEMQERIEPSTSELQCLAYT
jgi:hypothetical protein